MKLKHQLAVFNALTRLLIILVLWFSLPILIEKVVYKHIDKNLLEKKQNFIEHLDKEEINDFISRNDKTETFASFSTLHNEFLQLYQSNPKKIPTHTVFKNENRIIEDEQNVYRILYYDFSYENTNYKLEIGSSLSEIEDLTFVIRLFILIVLSIVIIFTFLVDTVFVEYLLKPFYKIIDKKIRLVNKPDAFDYTLITSHTTDFQELDLVLNQMMSRIQETFKLEKQFIANVSHELLTPISLLKNRFENLLQNESIDDNGQNKIVSSLKTLDTLKKIINNLLLISRIENNQFQNNEMIHFYDLIQDLLEELEDRIEEKSIVIHFQLEHHFSFEGNKTLLHVLFFNLLVNAIKYNSPNGNIVIKDGFLDKNYFISINDSGFGMTAEQLSKIFNRFERIDFNQEGIGLGLAIVNSIALFHRIKVEVKSAIKVGSTFLLLFPNTSKI